MPTTNSPAQRSCKTPLPDAAGRAGVIKPQLASSLAEKIAMNPNNAPRSWMLRLVSRRPAGPPSSLMQSRVEVCPPELWPSSLSWQSRLQRLGQQLRHRAPWLPATARPINRLALVKAEFQDSLADLGSLGSQDLLDKISRARSLRELWHLRSPVYGEVATARTQSEAERRLSRLNRHFPVRAPRNGLAALVP